MEEQWRPVVGYEGLYEVSNQGRVRSLDRNFIDAKGKPFKRKGRFLKFTKFYSYEGSKYYLRVGLSKNSKNKTVFIHRLVAQAFIPNPENLQCINHKDEDTTNNVVDNLEWCTHQYNMNYGTRNERISKANKGRVIGTRTEEARKRMSEAQKKRFASGMKPKYKSVEQYKDDVLIATYESLKEASEKTSISKSCICSCCRGYIKQTKGGFTWKYTST